MRYRIDGEALAHFVARQVAFVESIPTPELVADVDELGLGDNTIRGDEARALWLGAGLATHVGLAIFEKPERFISAAPSPVAPVAALAA